jgi:hypothetical protein
MDIMKKYTKYERERAEMYRRHESSAGPEPGGPRSFETTYALMKLFNPDMEEFDKRMRDYFKTSAELVLYTHSA